MTSSDGKHVAGAGGPTRNPTANKHGVTPALSSPARLRADSGAGKGGIIAAIAPRITRRTEKLVSARRFAHVAIGRA